MTEQQKQTLAKMAGRIEQLAKDLDNERVTLECMMFWSYASRIRETVERINMEANLIKARLGRG